MLSWVHKEFTLWRIFWYCFAFFYLTPAVLVFIMFVVLCMFNVSLPLR